MSAECLRMRVGLAEEPEVIALAQQLGVEEDLVVGKLNRLWGWGVKAADNEGRVRGGSLAGVNKLLGLAGFAEALVHVGWLVPEDGGILFPRFSLYNKPLKARKKPKKNQEPLLAFAVVKPAEFLEAWNQVSGFVPCQQLTAKRMTHFNARARSQRWVQLWRAALKKAATIRYCLGHSESGWRATVDWFLRPDTVIKILEGVYDHLGGKGPAPRPALSEQERAAKVAEQRRQAQEEAAKAMPLSEVAARLKDSMKPPAQP